MVDLDSIISAELPHDNPTLRRKVEKYMIHNSNHLTCPGSRCNRNSHCIYGFPHNVQTHTTVDDFGRIHWRCRNIEDAWVVPYCPPLLEFADCHFHFDSVITAKVFSYLYKYFFKGPDIAFFSIQDSASTSNHEQYDGTEHRNEVNDYQKARYLSAPEAAWRILTFEISRKEPAVENLPIHLPGENIPQFRCSDGSRSSTSLLDRYFLRPPELHHLRYKEYYEKYILYPYRHGEHLRSHELLECIHPNVLCRKISCQVRRLKVLRINTIPLCAGEPFYLRTLLIHHPATSFCDLWTVNDTVFSTFHEVACDLGLFNNEHEGFLALQEVVECLRTPAQLRFLFAQVVLEGYPAVPLWEHFRFNLTIDLQMQLNDDDKASCKALQIIETFLSHSHHHLSDFGLPLPQCHSRELEEENQYLIHNHHRLIEERDWLLQMLNHKQSILFEILFNTIARHRPGINFVEGKPGRGKTFLINALATALRASAM